MLQILNPSISADRAAWLAVWNAWPASEVFAHPGYLQLYETGTASARCAVYHRDGACVLYPFLLRDLAAEGLSPIKGAKDITSAYGYGGPFLCGGEASVVAPQFWKEFGAWAERENVVSEFVRFSLFRDSLLPYPAVTEMRAPNVVRSLDLEDESLWMDFDHKVRKNVARARRSGVTVEVDSGGDRLDEFLRIYYSTMERRGAQARYYFPLSYFQKLTANLAGHFVYVHALREGAVISSELVLVSARSVYSFLGGTDERHFESRPNDLLKYEIILWARRAGKTHFVLGGGYKPGDGIYKYKQSFAPTGIAPFFVGKRILREDLYRELVGRCAQPPAAGFFPAYRNQ